MRKGWNEGCKKSTPLETRVPGGRGRQEIKLFYYLIRKDKHILRDRVVERIMHPQRCLCSNPGTCEYVTLHDKGN